MSFIVLKMRNLRKWCYFDDLGDDLSLRELGIDLAILAVLVTFGHLGWSIILPRLRVGEVVPRC